MAYPQHARYPPNTNYYDAPRSAPLEPPQEYIQDDYDYNQSSYQQPAYDDRYQGGQYNAQQGQWGAQQPSGQAPRQQRQPPQHMGRGPRHRQDGGGYGGYEDRQEDWNRPPQDPYYQQNAQRGYGGDQRQMQGGHQPQNRDQRYERTAYGQQGFEHDSREQYHQPQHDHPGSRPAPQRSFSGGPGPEPSQQGRRPDQYGPRAPAPKQQGKARGEPQPNLAAAPKKKEKERIIKEPQSPETLPWDNPFPSFPGMEQKRLAAKDSSRPQTAASNRRSHESARSPDIVHNNSNNLHEPARGDQHYAPQHHLQQGQQIHPNNSYQDPPSQHQNNLADRSRRRPQPMNGHVDTQAMMSPPQPAFVDREQRSNTLPNEISEAMVNGNVSLRPHGQSKRPAAKPPRQSPPQQYQEVHQQSQPQQRHQRANSFDTASVYSQSTVQSPPRKDSHNRNYDRPNDYARRPSANSQRAKTPQYEYHNQGQYPHGSMPKIQTAGISHGSKGKFAQSQPTLHEAPLATRGNYAESMNGPSGSQEPNNFEPYRSPPVGSTPSADNDEDMPNFDNALSSPTHDKALHLELQNSNNSSPRLEDQSRGRSNRRGAAGDFAGQANRSRSQPNLRGQTSPNDFAGFDFGIQGGRPEVPPVDPRYNNYNVDPPQHKSPPNAEFQGQWQQSNNGPFGPPGRSQTDGFGPSPRGPGPEPAYRGSPASQPYANGNGLPARPRPGHSPGAGPGPGPRNSPAPGPVGRPPPRNGPTPQNSYRTMSEGSQRQPPGQAPPNAPVPNPHRPSNPDALPQHPAPSRPGHSQQAQSPPINQSNPARPPPVRQYGGASPGAQPNIAPPPPQPSAAPVTYEELQRLRGVVQSRPNDQESQLTLAKNLVEASSMLADEGGRADPKTKARNRERYTMEAQKLIKKLVGIGNTDAMFYMADSYGSGQLGLQKDPKEAFGLYQSAAKLNHAQSAYRVAVCCEIGLDDGGGTRKDPVKAIQWYQRAAQLGDVPAMYKLGVIQLKGLLGQSRNPREAVTWLQKAAERADEDNPHALHELALLYTSPTPQDGVPRNDSFAAQLLQKAADLGYKFSQFRLGQAHEQGTLGFPQDPRASIAWYSKAAAQEEHQSELGLSGWYLTGAEGVLAQNDTEAYLWARKAAQAGLAKAEYAMGYFTEVGIGAPADVEAAKRWYWKSASQNYPKARERLEDLRRGGGRIQKTRVSRSAINKPEGECRVM